MALAAGLLLIVVTWVGVTLSSRMPEDVVLSGGVLDGERSISAARSILVSATRVSSGAQLALESGGVVVFGDEFSVDSGARLAVSTRARQE